MHVYRIERLADRKGPFSNTGNGTYYDSMRHCEHPSCFDGPAPYEERGTPLGDLWETARRNEYHFGFTTPRQLVAWFSSAMGRSALAAKGYHVAIYEVDDAKVRSGRQQLAFIRPSAPIGSLDLVTLMPAGEC
ncbi:hypothetical protein Lo5R7ANS_03 [Mesorhizobium phage vB_MloP_Lo5R7ANS]|uniref:Uncharacterized protein n=1 Tax=Mesorhizobium phage vB_MloP_Lo5R7ANS TaxID=1527771 RepID=A0A076YJ14_9CAUD|nr:hypothetical protein Lo5R7ANS_03 [Mesorhizobium phage vB_MloP_Lo5R7ANS]AIK68473.1 hypothetical protein Lo5R7ANS_03 [Mesorhizobium phage vB_MloP_Lo5R7ANS]